MPIKHTAALAALLGGMAVSSLAYAAGMRTYANKAHTYTIQYPANWTVNLHSKGVDVEFDAPDKKAIVTALAGPGSGTMAQLKAQQTKVLNGLGTPAGPVTYKVAVIHGISYQLSELVTKNSVGKLIDVVLLDAVRGGNLFDFEAFLYYKGPTYAAETKTVQTMLNSIQLAH